MKRLLLSVAIGLGSLTATSAMAVTPAFSAQKVAQVKLPDLNFKQVMRQFYGRHLKQSYISDEYIDSIPKEGAIEVYRSEDKEDTDLAVMHPVIQYKNARNEQRYLVVIEKFMVFRDRDPSGPSWMADSKVSSAATKADLYSFKKLSDGPFQLVSKSLESIHYSGRPYRVNLQDANIPKGLQLLGNNLIGVIYETTQMRQGSTDSWLSVLHLPEDNFIGAYLLGDGGADNEGLFGGTSDEDVIPEDSPLYYNYDATVTVIPDGSKYYPIIKRYEGERPADSEADFIGRDFVWQFDPEEKEYKSNSPKELDSSLE
ncbi:hypothetical protein [uncultured Psychrobacter sp.]|uniref:hypothetical protein n=1 Tax=uncultured Psychrobacter sp. TaxID=259303 RepID=UPI002595165E|nr:hypothetical protein [uncultured Psychrobacter sp.]